MATRKKAEQAPMVDWREDSAQVDEDRMTLDTEERRRWSNSRRRFLRRQRRRRRFLAQLLEDDPELYEEMMWWRRYHPHRFRQKLVRLAVRQGWYKPRLYTTREKPPELMDEIKRRREEEG
ncbi:MAG: hypothetical protein JRI25_14070, partial [Deltaproteobacteria bacterium]|nr:hypothetical protein [Deltaproteobacteria bacterium]